MKKFPFIVLIFIGITWFKAYEQIKPKEPVRVVESDRVSPPGQGNTEVPGDATHWAFGDVSIQRDISNNFTVETLNNSHWQLDPVTNTTVKFTRKNQ